MERFIQAIQQECLDHFVVLGERHFDYLVVEWVEHYHTERPHQAKENDLLSPSGRGNGKKGKCKFADPPMLGQVDCRERLGGLLKHYYRNAA
jgi:putative transposase